MSESRPVCCLALVGQPKLHTPEPTQRKRICVECGMPASEVVHGRELQIWALELAE